MAALVLVVLVLGASAAFAYPDPPPAPLVDPNVEVSVLSDSASRASNSGLAFTGGDVAGLVVIGGALVGGGAVALRLSRRRVEPAID